MSVEPSSGPVNRLSGGAVRPNEPPRVPLTLVATLERVVDAGIERVWENVFDWEHLPWLHKSSFRDIELIEASDSHTKFKLWTHGRNGPQASLNEIVAEKKDGLYVARSLDGNGKGSEIWTRLTPLGSGRTRVEVEFHVPGVPAGRRGVVGAALKGLYERLWDEDEAMMVERQRQLDARMPQTRESRIRLGTIDEVRARLPLTIDLDGRRYRIVDVDGSLAVHAAVCPHLLGPLGESDVVDGCVTCPWHGYRFDVRTGKSADGRGLNLPAAPVAVIDGAGVVTIGWPEMEGPGSKGGQRP